MKSLLKRYIILILLLLSGAGCVPQSTIGKLRVTGPAVSLNGQPAHDGMTVHFGDNLATGPGSSAMLDFNSGGYLQLDENTDPMFTWLEEAKCILIRIVYGQAYLAKGQVCVEGPNINLVLNSEANLLLQGDLTELTLLRGSADLSRPKTARIKPGQGMTVRGRKIVDVRDLSKKDLADIVAWRKNYKFRFRDAETVPPLILSPPVRRTVPSTRTGTTDTSTAPTIREKTPKITTLPAKIMRPGAVLSDPDSSEIIR